LAKISPSGHRAPAPYEGLNVNFCKNPKCANFGVAETLHRMKRAPGAPSQPGDYSLVASGRGKPQLKCGLCGEILPMRSNQAVHEELARVMSYLLPPVEPSCTHNACALFGVPLSGAAGQYVRFTSRGRPLLHAGAPQPHLGGKAIRLGQLGPAHVVRLLGVPAPKLGHSADHL